MSTARDTWDRFTSWDLVLPPSRPSVRELRIVESAIAAIDRQLPVAVLGSTVEFRDLLHEQGFQRVFLFEKNLAHLKRVSRSRVYQSSEQLVHGDWLDTLPAHESLFSVVLSDLTSGNIPYERRHSFYHAVSHALRPNGIFVDKMLTHSKDLIPLPWLVAKYSNLPPNLAFANEFSCEALFCSELLSKGIVDSSAFYSELMQATKSARFHAFIRESQRITPLGCIWYYGRPWSELEADYCRELESLQALDDEPGSPYFGRLKVHIHRKS